MLKKTFVAAALLSAFTFSAAHAADGEIKFNGNIIAAACEIKSGDEDQTKALGDISADAFSGAGSTASTVDFQINVENCATGITNARVVFDGTKDADDTRVLKVSGAGTVATGVGVAIYTADGSTLLPIGTVSQPTAIASNAATLNFVAKYMATKTAVTGGSADAVTQFTVQYQ